MTCAKLLKQRRDQQLKLLPASLFVPTCSRRAGKNEWVRSQPPCLNVFFLETSSYGRKDCLVALFSLCWVISVSDVNCAVCFSGRATVCVFCFLTAALFFTVKNYPFFAIQMFWKVFVLTCNLILKSHFSLAAAFTSPTVRPFIPHPVKRESDFITQVESL